IEALKALGEIREEYVEESLVPWWEMEIDARKCNFCGVCFKICPSKSLFFREENNIGSIYQKPSECSKCSLCVKICPQNAIKYLLKNNIRVFIEEKDIFLVKGQLKRCLSCNSLILDNSEEIKCINCRKTEIINKDIRELLKTMN
ncbi:MAG: indolepyruvate ferredoxin oxidoreductase subunit alpha, partial [Candidatus Humimicrobiaceae bacterium]